MRGSKPGERRGGRQKGTPNKKTVMRTEIAQEALEGGVTPLEVMLTAMRTLWGTAIKDGVLVDQKAAETACAIAKDAAPFVHPRLSAVDANVDHGVNDTLADLMREIGQRERPGPKAA